jgi:hypothetical protein
MRLLRRIRNNPILILCVAVAGLGAWVALDSIGPGNPGQPDNPPVLHPRRLPVPMSDTVSGLPGAARSQLVSVNVLPKLRPGMTRVEVEGLIGPPTAEQIRPVMVADGRLTYRTTYELADPDPVMTVRPIQPRPRIPSQPGEPRSIIALEYDASRPGHPLLEVLYPDPLF